MSRRVLKSGAPIEDDEQIALVQWVQTWREQIPELWNFAAVPNGGSRAFKVSANGVRYSPEAQRLVRMGVSPGYPDLLLDAAAGHYHGLRIELKPDDPSKRASPEQRAWIARLEAAGYRAIVCRGWVAAARAIADYLYAPMCLERVPDVWVHQLPNEPVAIPARTLLWRRFSASVPRW